MALPQSSEHSPTNRTTLEVKSDREVVITRSLNAPARIVFEAWTNPELVKRWLFPKSLGKTIVSCEGEVRPGGIYRYVSRDGSGEEIAFSGTYSEVNPHSRLVYTQVFEPTAGALGWAPRVPNSKRSQIRSSEPRLEYGGKRLDVDIVSLATERLILRIWQGVGELRRAAQRRGTLSTIENANFAMSSPCATASSAEIAPDERPYTNAEPPVLCSSNHSLD